MGQKKKKTLTVDQTARDLAAFAIDRKDLKSLLSAISETSNLNLTTVEYELQLLKILSVGWAIAFFIPAVKTHKAPLTQSFWEYIREISDNISTLTQTTAGKSINYFDILKKRLNIYLESIRQKQDTSQDPSAIVGPVFAGACGSENNPAAILTGTKMFSLTLGAVKEYLNAIQIDDIKLN